MGPTWVLSAPCWPHVGPMKLVISEVMDTGYSLICEHFLWNCSQVTECNRVCTFDDKSTLVQVMAWCSQATSNYLSQCWARSILPYGITRSHWGFIEAEWCIYVSVNKHHWFRLWLVAWSVPSHYLNQCWNVVNWTLRNKLQWHFDWNSYIFIQENAFENVVWKMAARFCLGLHVFTMAENSCSEVSSSVTGENSPQ